MTKNKMTVFSNSELGNVRTIKIDGEPWVLGKDICEIFGDKNHNRSLGRIDIEDKQSVEIIDSMGRKQIATFVNESGLYALLFAMRPQKAHNGGVSDEYLIEIQQRIEKLRKFKRWVTHDVLPTIRETGGYIVPGREQEFVNNNPAIMAELQQLRTAVEIMQAQLMAAPDTYAQNTWKKNISQPLARKVQEKYAVGDKDAYKMIYIEMQSQFGFDGISAIIAYHHKYNLAQTVHVSAITAIADNEVYQGYFSQAANRLLAEREVAPSTPDDLTTAVAKALGYSKPCATVYSKIYSRMNTARGWKHMLTRHKCRTKKELIENNKEYGALYIKCCNEILNGHK